MIKNINKKLPFSRWLTKEKSLSKKPKSLSRRYLGYLYEEEEEFCLLFAQYSL